MALFGVGDPCPLSPWWWWPPSSVSLDSLVQLGVVNGKSVLDLCYAEDSKAEVDMNVVMTGSGKLVEVQGTAEGEPFTEATLLQMLKLAKKGIRELSEIQKKHVA